MGSNKRGTAGAMKQMKLFAGYDGGGTKTACVLTDETGRILGFGLGGPSNYLYCGCEVAAESVRAATAEAFADADLPMARLDTAYMASAAILIDHGDALYPFSAPASMRSM